MALKKSQLTENNWQKAITEHLSTLSKEDAQRFKSPSSLENCLDILHRSNREKRLVSRILEVLTPAFEPLQRFQGAIDVIAQTNAGIAAPIWGPVRMVVTVAMNHVKTLESLAAVLMQIASCVERHSNYEALFKLDRHVQDSICALYCDLIDFCARVVKFRSRPIRSVFVSFDREFATVMERIAHHSVQVDWAANAANIKQAKAFRDQAHNSSQVSKRADILQWLAPSAVEDDLDRFSNECMEGSCDWIHECAWLKQILQSPGRISPSRLIGPPGSGKTILTSFLTRYFECCFSCVLFYFCKGNDPGRRDVLHILRTLLAQLLIKDETLFTELSEIHHSDGRQVASSRVVIRRALQTALHQSRLCPIVILIDALDECEEPADLMSAFGGLSGGKVQVLCTGRASTQLDPLFASNIPLDLSQMQSAIEAYVSYRSKLTLDLRLDAESESFGKGGQSTRQKMVEKVCNIAEGQWLFAKLMMDNIGRSRSESSMQRQLDGFPNGLTQLYDGILEDIGSKLTAEELLFVQQIFLWIDTADYINPALVFRGYRLRSETLSVALQHVNRGEPVFDPLQLTHELCAPIISVTGSELDFAHFSAYQHLQQARKFSRSELPRLFRAQRLRRLHRATTAAWYFGSFDGSLKHLRQLRVLASARLMDETIREGFSGPDFQLSYALWDAFYSDDIPADLDEDEVEQASGMLRDLISFLTSRRCLRWLEVLLIKNFVGGWNSVLIENADKVLNVARKTRGKDDLAILNDFKATCENFFVQFRSILLDAELSVPASRPVDEKKVDSARDADGAAATQGPLRQEASDFCRCTQAIMRKKNNLVTPTPLEYAHHQVVRHDDMPNIFFCRWDDSCGRVFSFDTALEDHMREAHMHPEHELCDESRSVNTNNLSGGADDTLPEENIMLTFREIVDKWKFLMKHHGLSDQAAAATSPAKGEATAQTKLQDLEAPSWCTHCEQRISNLEELAAHKSMHDLRMALAVLESYVDEDASGKRREILAVRFHCARPQCSMSTDDYMDMVVHNKGELIQEGML